MTKNNNAPLDTLKRPLFDLRISITDRCNFRCTYCMPSDIFPTDYGFLPKTTILSYEEIIKIATNFVELGVRKVRVTGGEPLLRKDVVQLVEGLNKIENLREIGLTTNGVLLPKYAKQLKNAGLKRVNVSLDAINNDVFTKMNGNKGTVTDVLKGIDAALDAGLGVKINMVVRKGWNEQEIVPMAKYFKEKSNITLRFIEFMDVGASNGWRLDDVIPSKEILNELQKFSQLEPVNPDYYGEVAKRYKYLDSDSEIGFITSVTETFCSSCTRIRISADGKIYTCLFASEGHDIKSIVRNGATNDDIKDYIIDVWNKREDRYSDVRHINTFPEKRKKIEMSYIGG
ncbi:MAG: Molybdenum cofactor biosynthesis protein MoaA [Bacillales bacterium]|nr:Molybdenum cofactor biosynthesis protein MoaA [Bacillales bacterium]